MLNECQRTKRIALWLLLSTIILSRIPGRIPAVYNHTARNIGITLLARAKYVADITSLGQAHSDAFAYAENWLHEALRWSNNDPISHQGLGWACDAKGDLRAASTEWQRGNLSAEMFFGLGDQALDAGYFEEAKANYERAFAMSPQYRSAYYYRQHLVTARMGQEAPMPSALKAAVTIDDGWLNTDERVRAWVIWGLWFYDQERYPEAEEAIEVAISIASRFLGEIQPSLLSEAYYWLGRTLSQEKQLKEACAAYQSAISSNPTNVDAYMHYGLTAWYLGDLDESIGALERALKLSPRRPWTHVWLASVLYERDRDIQEAERLLKQAIQLGADDQAVLESVISFWKNTVKDERRTKAYCKSIRDLSNEVVYSSLKALCEE